ncbi:MAG: DMT family transporter [Chloroflexi bacterium]|nr:DMT family transporter [Chloroflexota bacterium]
MNGSVIALISAVCFAASNVCTRRGVLRVKDASLGVYVSVFIAPPLFLLLALLWGDVHSIASFTWLGYVWLALAGVVHFVGGRSFNYLAIRHLGANLTTIFGGLNLLYTILLSFLVLGEKITQGMAIGSSFIIIGPMLLAWTGRKGNPGPDKGAADKPRLSRKGILAGLACGIFFGISPLFIKLGLREGGSALAGTFISYVSAMLVLGMTMGYSPGRRSGVVHMERRALIWFTLAGLFVGMAQLLRYTAINVIPVSVASPLIATNPLFLVTLSFVVNRKIESFRLTTILGVVLVVAGTVLVYR